MVIPRWAIACIAACSGLATLALGIDAARIVGRYHRANPREVYVYSRVMDRAFTYAGRSVTLTDDLAEAANPVLVLGYGERRERLRVTIPWDTRLPGLIPHEKWLRVLRFARFEGADMAEFQRGLDEGRITDRLVIVSLSPRAGVDPATWGRAWKKDAYFEFRELLPDGAIEYQRLRYPTVSGVKRPVEGELVENSWQFQAALQLLPNPGEGPKHNFFGNAMERVGWRLPTAAATGVLFAFATAFAFAPTRRRS